MLEMSPTVYTVFLEPAAPHGGKRIAVFEDARGLSRTEMQSLARLSGAPLTVFVTKNTGFALGLRCFTPDKEKGESDSGALAALHHLLERCECAEEVALEMGNEKMQARFEDQWWLEQGTSQFTRVNPSPLFAQALNLEPEDLHPTLPFATVSTSRPKLIIPLSSVEVLDRIRPDYTALLKLNEHTHSSGIIALALEGSRNGTNAEMRFFMPRVQKEDNAGANTAACAAAYLRETGLLEQGVWSGPVLELGQGYASGKPSRVFVDARGRILWVGGLVQ